MKTAISIPDHVFAEAEKLARRLKKSRSQLYSEAVAEYTARHNVGTITDAINRTIDEVGDEPDEFVAEAARRTLERSEW
jgi:metal-responsive CopG/Arc/MetJ family transcriptional regulator